MQAQQKTDPAPAVPSNKLRVIVRIVLLYALFAALWILFSDRVLELVLNGQSRLMAANTVKGLIFVAVTSLLLFYILLRFSTQQTGEAAEKKARLPQNRTARGVLYAGIFLLAAVFVLIGATGIQHSRNSYREAAGRQLQSIAQLKASQLEGWLTERYADTRLAGSSPAFNTLLMQWRQGGNPALGEQLRAHLEAYRSTYRYREILICDAQGNILLRTGADSSHGLTAELHDTVNRSIASGETLATDFFIMHEPPPAHVHLDFVAPLRLTEDKKTADAAIVLRADVEATIYAYLQSWPVPSDSAETVLFQQEGDRVRHLNKLRHKPDLSFSHATSMANKKLPAVQALASDYLPGDLLEGEDYRGMPIMGAAQPVAGTTWWVLAKINRDEILRPAHRDALWIGFASLLTWLVSATLAILLLQRRELQHSQQQRHEQARQLNALKLLSEIAYGSADVIFAKDRQGRYTLYNRAACAYVGKTEDQIIGQDDTAVYPPEQAARVRAHDLRVMDENRVMSMEDTFDTLAGTRTFLAIKGPLHDEAGNVIGMYGIARDITERKTNEETLRRSNEELQRFNRAMIGRELEMIRLKREVNQLAAALGQQPPYELSAMDDTNVAPHKQKDSRP